MGTIEFTNKMTSANFSYVDGEYKLTGRYSANQQNEIQNIDGGSIRKNGICIGYFSVCREEDKLRYNVNGIDADELPVVAPIVKACVLKMISEMQ